MAALLLIFGSDTLQTAVALGDTRSLSLFNIHTKEDLTVVYKRNGRYDEEGMKKLNRFLRDWRLDRETTMDPKAIDLLWEVHRDVGAKGPIHIVCGYRSAETNAKLRKRSRGVARFSRHMSGQAIDYFIPGVPIEEVRNAGLRLQRGGVGYYPSSGVAFVHMDVGSVRHWPRIPEHQLAQVMKSRTAVAMAKPAAEEPKRSFFSSLFKKPVVDEEEEDEAPNTKRSRMPAVAARAPGAVPAPHVEPGNSVPLPPVRPAGKPASIQVASPTERPAEATTTVAKTSKVFQVAAAVAPTAEAPIIEAPASKPALTYHAAAAARALEWSADALSKPPKLFQVAETSVDAAARKSASTPPVAAAPAEPPVAASSPNDSISARAIWQGPVPPIPPADIPNVSPAEAKAVARRHPDAIEQASSGSIAPWPMPSQKRESERVPAELALAYAAQVEAKERTTLARTAPLGVTAARQPAAATPPAPPGSTVLVKQPTGTARAAQPVVSPVAAVAPVRTVQRLDNPWMRAMITAPSAQNFMTTMIIGANDFRTLRPFLHKPPFLVRMAFSDHPTPGLEPDHFRGEAIVFISTVTFSNRTALLH